MFDIWRSSTTYRRDEKRKKILKQIGTSSNLDIAVLLIHLLSLCRLIHCTVWNPFRSIFTIPRYNKKKREARQQRITITLGQNDPRSAGRTPVKNIIIDIFSVLSKVFVHKATFCLPPPQTLARAGQFFVPVATQLPNQTGQADKTRPGGGFVGTKNTSPSSDYFPFDLLFSVRCFRYLSFAFALFAHGTKRVLWGDAGAAKQVATMNGYGIIFINVLASVMTPVVTRSFVSCRPRNLHRLVARIGLEFWGNLFLTNHWQTEALRVVC